MNKIYNITKVLLLLIFLSCQKQDNIQTSETSCKYSELSQDDIVDKQNFENNDPVPLNFHYITGFYDISECINAPNGKKLCVYNNEAKETPWGTIYSPIVYLYNKNGEVLSTYDTFELISNDFWVGDIDRVYNAERNSFDLIFSLDAYGNYGTGYIDLETNEYVRELKTLEKTVDVFLEQTQVRSLHMEETGDLNQ